MARRPLDEAGACTRLTVQRHADTPRACSHAGCCTVLYLVAHVPEDLIFRSENSVLHCTALYSTVLCCTVLYCAVQCYTWWPTSQRILSSGVLKTWCRATVSSTTPRLDPKWPPVLETVKMVSDRTSSESCFSSCEEEHGRTAEKGGMLCYRQCSNTVVVQRQLTGKVGRGE